MEVNWSYRLDRQSGLNLSLVGVAPARISGVAHCLPCIRPSVAHSGGAHALRYFWASNIDQGKQYPHSFGKVCGSSNFNLSQQHQWGLLSKPTNAQPGLWISQRDRQSSNTGAQAKEYIVNRINQTQGCEKKGSQLCVLFRQSVKSDRRSHTIDLLYCSLWCDPRSLSVVIR